MIRAFGPAELAFILAAVKWTILLSAGAFLLGGIGGLITAIARLSPSAWVRTVAILYIRLIQGTPLLIQLFLIFFGLTLIGFDVDPWAAAIIGMSVNTSAFLGEIWRGSIEAVPKGQWDAARALGLNRGLQLRFIILPQSVRLATPPTVGFLVQVVKATSIASIVGLTEVTRAGQIINNATFRPFLVFSIVAAVYFVLCWPLSIASAALERRYAPAQR